MGVEDSASKRMDKNEAEYCPRGSDDKEYDNDEDELESSEFNSHCGAKVTPSMQMAFFQPHLVLNPSTPANTDRLHHDDRQYQSVGFYKAEKQLIDRY
jgi:hypothetical protein